MSLIIDAIKKAQQLRLKESKDPPFFREHAQKSDKRRPKKTFLWIVSIVALGGLTLAYLLGDRLLLSPMTSAPGQKAAHVDGDGIDSIVAGNEFNESRKEDTAPIPKENAQLLVDKFIEAHGEEFPTKPKTKIKKKKARDSALETEFKKPQGVDPLLREDTSTLIDRDDSPIGPKTIKKKRGKPLDEPGTGKEQDPDDSLPYPSSMKTSVAILKQGPPVKPLETKQEGAKDLSPTTARKEMATPSAPVRPSVIIPPLPQHEEVSIKPAGEKERSDRDPLIASEVLTYFNLGIASHREREFSKAIQAYQRVIELDPTYVEAYNDLGIIYQELGDFDKAYDAYRKCLQINPRYEKAHNNLGILLYLKGRYEESIQSFQKALSINPYNVESYINLGILYKKTGQTDRAIASYQKALTLSPDNGETQYNIGLLYEQLEKVDLAIRHYQKFIQLSKKTHPDLVAEVQRHLNYLMTVRTDRAR
jgi:Flp pilus assembly protein TadD